MHELKYIMTPYSSVFSKLIKRVLIYKKFWLLQNIKDIYTGGL